MGADQRARSLRANATQAERRLWRGLRILKIKGLHFRRQAPIGRYYVDFVCHSAKLIIELDGSQHKQPAAVIYDNERTRFLRSRGYNVLRFWNGDVMHNREGVLDAIFAAASDPHPKFARARSAAP